MSDQKVYSITPANLVVDGFVIASVYVIFGQNTANIVVNLMSGNLLVQSRTLQMTGSDYTGWQSDTPYVANWVATQLGFTLA